VLKLRFLSVLDTTSRMKVLTANKDGKYKHRCYEELEGLPRVNPDPLSCRVDQDSAVDGNKSDGLS